MKKLETQTVDEYFKIMEITHQNLIKSIYNEMIMLFGKTDKLFCGNIKPSVTVTREILLIIIAYKNIGKQNISTLLSEINEILDNNFSEINFKTENGIYKKYSSFSGRIELEAGEIEYTKNLYEKTLEYIENELYYLNFINENLDKYIDFINKR